MNQLVIRELYQNISKYEQSKITLSGWVKTLRDSKNFGFIELNDGSCFKNIQVVFDSSLPNFEEIRKLTIISSIEVTGTVVKTENAKQPFEIKATDIKIIHLADSSYPLQKKRHSFEY